MCYLYSGDDKEWKKGVLYGEGQNLARRLMEAPANHVTPTVFADTIEQKLSPFSDKVTVNKRYRMSHKAVRIFLLITHPVASSGEFCATISASLCLLRAKPWIESEQMGAFLSVAEGSEEPPVFLEVHYTGSPDSKQAPLVLVGKGVTFDR